MSPTSARFLAGFLLASAISPFANAAWQAPLSETEQARVSQLALKTTSHDRAAANDLQKTEGLIQQQRSLTANTASVDDTATPLFDLDREVLQVDIKRTKKSQSPDSPQRVADVFIFDYSTDTTELHRIDVANDRVLETLVVDSVHLPLNERESEIARTHLAANTSVMETLASEYSRSFGRALQSPAELDMKVSIWQPQAHQINANPFAARCDRERCALVSIFTRDNYSFSLEPVVNLKRGSIHTGAVQ